MGTVTWINSWGDFTLEGAQRYPGTYFPLANEAGMISSVTPMLAGDCKTGQNTYLLPPASAETLHESRAARNFWVITKNNVPWSAAGQSAPQQAKRFSEEEENVSLTGGLLWQKTERCQKSTGLRASVLSFVPAGKEKIEIMQVTLENGKDAGIELTPAAVVPVYGRSADNIRDHGHVTSLLHRVEVRPHGLDVKPTMTFDERGHQPGQVTYRIWGGDETGAPPKDFLALTRDFVGEGSWDWPEAIVKPDASARLHAGECACGGEVAAVLFFPAVTLLPGEKRRYQIILAVDDDPALYLQPEAAQAALERTICWWREQASQSFYLRDPGFQPWMRWVAVQPVLRRICGCSFLPHHDYGRGGRGWRDLWQDSLALLLTSPAAVREDLLGYFAGVRPDGTNATIIGSVPGEFKADRNDIPRVWMDHGFWPLFTVALYINETGDLDFLKEEQTYFLLGVRKKVLKQNLITAPVRQDWDNKKVRSIGLVSLLRIFCLSIYALQYMDYDIQYKIIRKRRQLSIRAPHFVILNYLQNGVIISKNILGDGKWNSFLVVKISRLYYVNHAVFFKGHILPVSK